MRKHFKTLWWCVALVVFGVFWPGMTGSVRADPAAIWLSPSALSLHKISEVSAPPFSVNGNIDCIQKDSSDCVFTTLFGSVDQNNRAKLNNTSAYRSVINQVSGLPRIMAIPHSNSIISYTTEPPYGFYLYFTESFAASITPATALGSAELQYRINRPPDARLTDRNNNRLAADYNSISFSADGKWMVVSQPNVAVLRVNLETYEVLPFAPGFDYTIGVGVDAKTAITNDGRYAVVASRNFTRFAIYDLGTCPAAPATITGPVACQSRNLRSFMLAQIPGYITSTRIRFIDNGAFGFYASYNNGSGNKIAKFVLKAGGGTLNQLEYLALGDSYISGEGAFNYLEGTDTADNRCHLSAVSYPFLLGYSLDYNSYRSVACSGATIKDILDASLDYEGQTKIKIKRGELSDASIDIILETFRPGNINQLDFVKQKMPKVTTVSIGGNDIGFSQIVKKCIAPGTCYSSYEDRLELVRQINKTFPDLVETYQEIANSTSPDSKIYAVGYPQLVKPDGNCAVNVRLNSQEIEFSRLLISYINLVISRAASRAGVVYVNVEDALTGHRLCETSSNNMAVNGLTAGNDFPDFLDGPIGNESYHPNQLGHRLLKQKVQVETENLSLPMPLPNLSISAPSETGQPILEAAAARRPIYSVVHNQEITSSIVFKEAPIDVAIDDPRYPLKPSSTFQAVLHSDPINLGSFMTSSDGKLVFQFLIPAGAPSGWHDLHLYGLNMAGEPIDIYKTIYVGSSSTDLDGDGVPNSLDDCSDSVNSGVDYDQDGIDDACDGFIDVAPPFTPPAPIDEGPSADQNRSDDTVVAKNTVIAVRPAGQERSESAYVNIFRHLDFLEKNGEADTEVLSTNIEKMSFTDGSLSPLIRVGLAVSAGVMSVVAYILKRT